MKMGRILHVMRRLWRALKVHIEKELLRDNLYNRVSCSCYPYVVHKRTKQIVEEIVQLWMTGKGSWDLDATVNHYFLFGLDREGKMVGDFVFQREYYDELRNALNKGWDPLLNNKRVAAVYLSACGLPINVPYGIARKDGKITMLDGLVLDFKVWLSEHPGAVFCKPNDGMQGMNCFKAEACRTEGNLVYKINGMKVEGDYPLSEHLVESYIEQHHLLNAVSPDAVNPLRVRTLRRGGKSEFVSAYMCFAPAGSYVSNGVACGIMVPIDQDGTCFSDGLCEIDGPMRGRYSHFIGTTVEVKGFVVPFVKEAIALACRAHDALPEICAIGWDIAITESGPVLIEGNADYGTCTYQAVCGIGERQFFETMMKSLL